MPGAKLGENLSRRRSTTQRFCLGQNLVDFLAERRVVQKSRDVCFGKLRRLMIYGLLRCGAHSHSPDVGIVNIARYACSRHVDHHIADRLAFLDRLMRLGDVAQ